MSLAVYLFEIVSFTTLIVGGTWLSVTISERNERKTVRVR